MSIAASWTSDEVHVFPELLDALADDGRRAVVGPPASVEELALGLQRLVDDLLAPSGGKACRDLERTAILLLGSQPHQPCLDGRLLAGQLAELGVGLGGVEDGQWLAPVDDVALAHQKLAQDAALQVLDRLAMAVDDGKAVCHHRAVQGRQQRPADEPAEACGDRHQAGDDRRAEARLGFAVQGGEAAQRGKQRPWLVHHRGTARSTGSRAIFGSAGRGWDGFCCAIARMTWPRCPKCSTMPSRNTSSLSAAAMTDIR